MEILTITRAPSAEGAAQQIQPTINQADKPRQHRKCATTLRDSRHDIRNKRHLDNSAEAPESPTESNDVKETQLDNKQHDTNKLLVDLTRDMALALLEFTATDLADQHYQK